MLSRPSFCQSFRVHLVKVQRRGNEPAPKNSGLMPKDRPNVKENRLAPDICSHSFDAATR